MEIFIGNLPYVITEDELREAISQSGEIRSLRMVTEGRNNIFKGFAFVRMATEEESLQLLGMNKTIIAGRSAMIFPARKRQQRHRRPQSTRGGSHGRRVLPKLR